ncbi:MAG TPA: thiolase family protein [Pseudonocardiaceae bacterium]|nr:thiolase family protein [Pseudonocardiaceae bacterium]
MSGAGATVVVGIGNTDYARDWVLCRSSGARTDGYGYAATAFTRALSDAGITKDDVDGLYVGAPLAYERTAEVLGLDVKWASTGDASQALQDAAAAITMGWADCVALVYGNDQRSAGTAYGGPGASYGDQFLSYVYYEPWGFTSQGALYALLARRYLAVNGLDERLLGEVAVAQRMHAQLNPDAVMRSELTPDDYLAARMIVEPLRLFDYTIVNDGGVALLVVSDDFARSRGLSRRGAHITAFGRHDMNREATSLAPRLLDFYHTGHAAAARSVYESASVGPEEIATIQIYDSFSVHVPLMLAGLGFTTDDGVGDFIMSGALRPGGRLPTNTSGGHLSESYMQGWGHLAECVRQVRGEAGARQVDRARYVQYASDVAGKVFSAIFEKA